MLRLIIVLAILALGACATQPQPVASAAPQAAPAPDTRVQRAQSEDGKDVMTLHRDACPTHVMQMHGVPAHVPMRLANLSIRDGSRYVGCWIEHMGTIVTVWDDGDVIPMPQGAFQPVIGAVPARTGKLDA